MKESRFIIPMFSSIAITILFQKLITTAFYDHSFVYRLFIPAGDLYQRIVPSLILFLFFWVLVDLLIKLFLLRLDKKYLNHLYTLNIPYMLQSKNSESILSNLNNIKKRIKKSRVYRIVCALLDNLNSSNDVQRSHEFFRHQTDIETDNTQSNYTISRIFIWAMPILGFIGTVLGISLAVEHFSGFLTGDIDKIELVKRELSNVARGLSFAFDTTLLGLIASLISMLVVSFVQKCEENNLSNIEELGLSIIENCKLPQSNKNNGNLKELYETSIKCLNVVDTQIKELSIVVKNFNTNFHTSSNNLSKQLEKSSALIAQKFESLQRSQDINNHVINNFNNLVKLLGQLQRNQVRLGNLFETLAGPFQFQMVPFKEK